MLLAIETSCDETAAAVFDLSESLAQRKPVIVADMLASQIEAHSAYGGVVPELAARMHAESLPLVLADVLKAAQISIEQVKVVAVTVGPGLKGSLLTGLCFAKGLAYARSCVLVGVNHLEGHLYAARLSGGEYRYPCMGLIVSGGHTELVLMHGLGRYEVVCRTRDDAAGEAFDKSAQLLGLAYPGGPALSRLAENGDGSHFKLPVGVVADDGSFSFSGLKTAVRKAFGEMNEGDGPHLAAAVESVIVESLLLKTSSAVDRYKPEQLVLTGGVAANKLLRTRLSEFANQRGIELLLPPIKWCTDNAAMIGAVAIERIVHEQDRFLGWSGSSGMLGPEFKDSQSALARWPLEEVRP